MLTLFFAQADGFEMGQVDRAGEALAAAVARAGGPGVRVRCRCRVDERSEAPAPAGNPPSAASGQTGPSPEADLDPKVRSVLEALDGELV